MHPHKPPQRLKDHGPDSEYEQEHVRIGALLAAVEDAADAGSARPALEELHASLEAHFAEEESPDGVFTWLAAMDSSLGPRLRELEDDHRALSAEIDALLALARGESAPAGADYREVARAFSAHLRRHERLEHEALRQATGR